MTNVIEGTQLRETELGLKSSVLAWFVAMTLTLILQIPLPSVGFKALVLRRGLGSQPGFHEYEAES